MPMFDALSTSMGRGGDVSLPPTASGGEPTLHLGNANRAVRKTGMLLHGRVGDSTPGETDKGQSVRLTPALREATRGTLAVNIGIGLIGHTVMTRRHADGAEITRLCCRFVPALQDKGAARQLGSSRTGTSGASA